MRKALITLFSLALAVALPSCALRVTIGAPAEPEPDYGVGLSGLKMLLGDANGLPEESEDPSDRLPSEPPTEPDGPIGNDNITEPTQTEPSEPPTEPPTEAPTEPPTEPPTQAPTEAPTEPPAPPKLTAEEMKAIAMSMIGHQVSELIAAIGSPVSTAYVPSCLVDGEDGMLYYDGFTVYTERTGGLEEITYVE